MSGDSIIVAPLDGAPRPDKPQVGTRDYEIYMQMLLEQLSTAELPLDRDDLKALQHFVEVVRWEVREEGEAPNRKATRVNFYQLNERGLRYYENWRRANPPLVVVPRGGGEVS